MPSQYRIEILTKDHDVKRFDCGDEGINRFLREDAIKQQEQKYLSTYVTVNGRDVGTYATVANGVVELTDVEKEDFPDFPYPQIPALLLARLGRDIRYKGSGLGEIMIKFCIGLAHDVSEKVGCRVVCVHSYVGKAAYYESLGFVQCGGEQEASGKLRYVTLYFDLKG
ncbi:MAG: hypothetical protein ACE5IJ_04515 [Thermoplasmata archaeon]